MQPRKCSSVLASIIYMPVASLPQLCQSRTCADISKCPKGRIVTPDGEALTLRAVSVKLRMAFWMNSLAVMCWMMLEVRNLDLLCKKDVQAGSKERSRKN